MLIDWFTVLAQALNFIILVWLMKHFLYRPILSAIDSREKTIAKQIIDADKITKDVNAEKIQFNLKNQAFDKERAAILKKTTEDAHSEAVKINTDAKKTVADTIAKGKVALLSQQQNFSQMLSKRTEEEVLNLTRKVLKDLADATLEERMVNIFIKNLREMPKEKWIQLKNGIKSPNQQIAIRSSFQLSTDQRDLIEAAIKENVNDTVQFNFEISERLVSGIELTTNGQKISWNIGDYINLIEKNLGVDSNQILTAPVETEKSQLASVSLTEKMS